MKTPDSGIVRSSQISQARYTALRSDSSDSSDFNFYADIILLPENLLPGLFLLEWCSILAMKLARILLQMQPVNFVLCSRGALKVQLPSCFERIQLTLSSKAKAFFDI